VAQFRQLKGVLEAEAFWCTKHCHGGDEFGMQDNCFWDNI
jgi:hypothetical protein